MHRISQLCLAVAATLFFVHAAPAQAAGSNCVAVFEFELRDMSLEGQMNGVNDAETKRLGLLAAYLRNWLAEKGDQPVCDMGSVAAEAKASNLFACGCVQRLARGVDARLAVVGSVHKLSNLILGIQVEIHDVENDKLLAQLNADIRSNSDSSWIRGLDWLIQHRLAGAFASIGGPKQ